MKLFDKFLELFRKKEYFEVDYDSQNTYSITFRELSNNDISKIKKVIIDFDEANSVNDYKYKLIKENAFEYNSIDDLMQKIKETIHEDYKETYFEAIKENWIFNYFLSNPKNIYKDTILINNRLSFPEHLKKGSVIYPVLAIKKHTGKYYFWSLLEKDDD